jgi:hypothetical protein
MTSVVGRSSSKIARFDLGRKSLGIADGTPCFSFASSRAVRSRSRCVLSLDMLAANSQQSSLLRQRAEALLGRASSPKCVHRRLQKFAEK